MIAILARSLVVAGAATLIASLFPVRRLLVELPSGLTRRRWYVMTVLVFGFITGYLAYYLAFRTSHVDLSDLLVPTIFFVGACFVWLSGTLALQTAVDVRRVSVLEYESITDTLMGLYNRRYLDRRLEEEVARARRYRLPLSALLMDVDHFKTVNDTYGHQVGDLVLNFLGRLCQDALRQVDIAARYGGEEVMIVCPNTELASAMTLAERLRERVETHEYVLAGEATGRKGIRITVSIGVAELDPASDDVASLVKAADKALYDAKSSGRNRASAATAK